VYAGPMLAASIRPDYDSPTALKAFLEAEGLAMSKRFGQNFLVSPGARRRVMDELHAEPGAAIWEIGPGLGAMTALALDAGLAVTAFEIDHGFARALARIFGGESGFALVEGDFLDTWRDRAVAPLPARIFGNLPYSAANAIVAALLEGGLVPPRMVFTVQKEAALRMAAVPGGKDYSAFSVLCTSVCKVRLAFDIGAASFWPKPNVTSTVVTLTPRPEPVAAGDRAGFCRFVRAAFSSRRKTLKNNLRAIGHPEDSVVAALETLGIRVDVRAEALRPEELAAVHAALPA
jgi:16S rRNA (adenine1518-N6/adenine1519-N6)-dimethyltransferase